MRISERVALVVAVDELIDTYGREAVEDVMARAVAISHERSRVALDEMMRLSEEMGLYDLPPTRAGEPNPMT